MKRVFPGFLFALVLCFSANAADPIFGVWRMRTTGKNEMLKSQVFKVEEVAGGARFTYDIEMGKSKISYFFVTRFDGNPVDAIMNGQPFSRIRMKKVSPYEYDMTAVDQATEQHHKTTITSDGKTLATDGTIKTNGKSIPAHVVFDRVP
jgi:hypothetical protein